MRTWKWAWGCCCLQLLQAFLQGLIAGAVFHDGERLGGRLAIGPEEGDAMTVACGIDTDADAVEGRGGRPWVTSGDEETGDTGVRRVSCEEA